MIKNADYVETLIVDPVGLSKKAQVGVDLTVKSINKIGSGEETDYGKIFNDESLKAGEKNSFGIYVPVIPTILDISNKRSFFVLEEGVYSIEFNEGLDALPANNTAFIIHRSTLGRNGIIIRSAVYDPGFTTPNMGAIMTVGRSCIIEINSRVAQLLIFENEPAELYNGNYQGKKDFR